MKFIFVIDVESIGLTGEGYAVAGGVYEFGRELKLCEEFCFSCSPEQCAGDFEDRKWVAENIPPIKITHENPHYVRNAFWHKWVKIKQNYPGVVMAAECGWPVEARFLNACVDYDSNRKWEGPYPLHDIASFLAAAGKDPMANYERLPHELPKHDPLADVRQSARLLWQVVCKIKYSFMFSRSMCSFMLTADTLDELISKIKEEEISPDYVLGGLPTKDGEVEAERFSEVCEISQYIEEVEGELKWK